jgi:hypothetical protein
VQGNSRARIAAWLFRLVFYGGSLTLIGLHFLGGGGDATAARPTELRGHLPGGAAFTAWAVDGRITGWRAGVVHVRCTNLEGPFPVEWASDGVGFKRPSPRAFRGVHRVLERIPDGSVVRSRAISSGTVAPDGRSARGRLRIRSRFRYPHAGLKGRCDSGPLFWRVSRKP